MVCKQIPEHGSFQLKDLFCEERQGIIQSTMDCKLQIWGMLLNTRISKILVSCIFPLLHYNSFLMEKLAKWLRIYPSSIPPQKTLSPELPLFFFLIIFSVLCHKLPWQPKQHRVFEEKPGAHFGVYCIFSKLNRAKPYGPTFQCDNVKLLFIFIYFFYKLRLYSIVFTVFCTSDGSSKASVSPATNFW